jgi:hypothetical protein
MFRTFCKDRVRADLGAPFAVDALGRIVLQAGLSVTVKHQITPMSRLTPSAIPASEPVTAITAMIFTYRKISFLTPVFDV